MSTADEFNFDDWGIDDEEDDDGVDEPVDEAEPDTRGEEPDVDHGFEAVDETVDLAVTQVNYTVDRGEPIIHVFGRVGLEGVHVRVHGFRPYFYAAASSISEDKLDDLDGVAGWEKTGPAGEPYESIRGDPVWRVYGNTPRDVGSLRGEFEHYEADVLFPNRFLVDKDVTSGIRVPLRDGETEDDSIDVHESEIEPVDEDGTPRVNFFDIEVDDRNGFPEDGKEEIICISSHDSYRDEYVLWLSEPPSHADVPTDIDGYEPIGDGVDVDVKTFETEEAMLDAFLAYITETDPDVLSGWNFDDFDAPYLLDRLEILNDDADEDLDPDRLSRVDEVWRDDWNGPNVKGRVVLDLLYAYERTQFTELDSYRLDAIGELELGVGKERYTGDIGDLWEQDPERLLEYNLRDVELCVELDRDQSIVAFWDEVRTFVGCRLDDAPTPGDAVDMYVLQKLHGEYVLPTKGSHEGEDYEGGAVFDPITGVRDMVAVLDLKSLYPMCMVTVNASPETKVDPETYDGETFVAPNGVHFRKEPDGVIREMVEELLAEREEKKSIRNSHDPSSDEYVRYDRQQRAVKVIMNSLYGTLGWVRFRLYDKEMGAAVTATGRSVIQHTSSVTEDMGHEVIYGDTDSVLLEVGGETVGEVIESAEALEDQINDAYDEFAERELNVDLDAGEEHRFQIEFEKLYRRFFQAGKKKRYAGHIVWKEGKDVDDIDITGFEYQRSDVSAVTKRVQKEVIERIVTGQGIDAVKSYLRSQIKSFQTQEADIDEIAMPGGVGKALNNYSTDAAHVRGATYANLLLGTNFRSGSKPKRLYLGRVHPSFFASVERGDEIDTDCPLYVAFKRSPDVICFEYADEVPEEFEPDWEKMLEKTLRNPIEPIVEALDLSWEDVEPGQKQAGLSQFA